MQTISVVRNAETVSLTTIIEGVGVYVDIPLPKNIGDSAVIRSGCLNLSAPSAARIKTKRNTGDLKHIGSVGTVYAIPALQEKHRATWKEYFAKCAKRTFRKQMQDTGAAGDTVNHNQKRKSTKRIRGEKKTK